MAKFTSFSWEFHWHTFATSHQSPPHILGSLPQEASREAAGGLAMQDSEGREAQTTLPLHPHQSHHDVWAELMAEM